MNARDLSNKIITAVYGFDLMLSGVTALTAVHGASPAKLLWFTVSFSALAVLVAVVIGRGPLAVFDISPTGVKWSTLGTMLFLTINTTYLGRIAIDSLQGSHLHLIDVLIETWLVFGFIRGVVRRRAIKSGHQVSKAPLHIDAASTETIKR